MITILECAHPKSMQPQVILYVEHRGLCNKSHISYKRATNHSTFLLSRCLRTGEMHLLIPTYLLYSALTAFRELCL